MHNEELLNINGGGGIGLAIAIGIGVVFVLISGIIDGLTRPFTCDE